VINVEKLRAGTTKGYPSGVYLMASTVFPVAKVGMSGDMKSRYKSHVDSLYQFESESVPLDILTLSFKVIGVAPSFGRDSRKLESVMISKLKALGFTKLPVGLEWFEIPPSDHGFVLDCLGLVRIEKYQEVYGS
jgi:hypothetical protein